jgi:hypothetical protein
MTAPAEAVLLGDIGATNARFACLVDGALGPIKWIEVAHGTKSLRDSPLRGASTATSSCSTLRTQQGYIGMIIDSD